MNGEVRLWGVFCRNCKNDQAFLQRVDRIIYHFGIHWWVGLVRPCVCLL